MIWRKWSHLFFKYTTKFWKLMCRKEFKITDLNNFCEIEVMNETKVRRGGLTKPTNHIAAHKNQISPGFMPLLETMNSNSQHPTSSAPSVSTSAFEPLDLTTLSTDRFKSSSNGQDPRKLKYNKTCKACRFKRMLTIIKTIPKLKLKLESHSYKMIGNTQIKISYIECETELGRLYSQNDKFFEGLLEMFYNANFNRRPTPDNRNLISNKRKIADGRNTDVVMKSPRSSPEGLIKLEATQQTLQRNMSRPLPSLSTTKPQANNLDPRDVVNQLLGLFGHFSDLAESRPLPSKPPTNLIPLFTDTNETFTEASLGCLGIVWEPEEKVTIKILPECNFIDRLVANILNMIQPTIGNRAEADHGDWADLELSSIRSVAKALNQNTELSTTVKSFFRFIVYSQIRLDVLANFRENSYGGIGNGSVGNGPSKSYVFAQGLFSYDHSLIESQILSNFSNGASLMADIEKYTKMLSALSPQHRLIVRFHCLIMTCKFIKESKVFESLDGDDQLGCEFFIEKLDKILVCWPFTSEVMKQIGLFKEMPELMKFLSVCDRIHLFALSPTVLDAVVAQGK